MSLGEGRPTCPASGAARRPDGCGPQGPTLQVCSCSGLVPESQSELCLLSSIRHRTSLICRPLPQDWEHWEQKREGVTDGSQT